MSRVILTVVLFLVAVTGWSLTATDAQAFGSAGAANCGQARAEAECSGARGHRGRWFPGRGILRGLRGTARVAAAPFRAAGRAFGGRRHGHGSYSHTSTYSETYSEAPAAVSEGTPPGLTASGHYEIQRLCENGACYDVRVWVADPVPEVHVATPDPVRDVNGNPVPDPNAPAAPPAP